ncbi:hypothetical protein Tco_0782338 [Tanacetum coccineum]
MEAIQAFLKEYDHIPPNEKCMALLLAEERFLKIKQTMEEEQNQPEIEPNQGELTNVVIEVVDTFLVSKDSIPPGIESNFDPGGSEIDFSQNIEDDDTFTFVIRTFLPFLTYPADSLLLLSTGRYPDFEDSRVHGTDIKEMDKIKAKTDKAKHEKERVPKSRESSSYGQQKSTLVNNGQLTKWQNPQNPK